MKRISVIGAGNVGATCANVIAHKDLARSSHQEGSRQQLLRTRVIGVTNDYLKTKGSSIVVITSGLPRKPGMSRDDLIKTNSSIVKEVTEKVVKYSPDAIIIVVSNPLDVMTYCSYLASNKPASKVFGMAGILDTGRYRAFVADALDVSPKDILSLSLGGHGDTMVPLPRYTSVNGIPITELLNQDEIDKIVERTRFGGGELVNLMGTSAWYAPGAAAAQMVESIVDDQKRIFPVCAYLNGEYGLKDVYLGVPVKLGSNGVEGIIEIQLNKDEKKMLIDSANSIKKVMKVLDDLKIFE